jgi:hypothetical protein
MRVLHLGSGKNDIRPGWVNIDTGIPNESKPDGTVSIDYDLRKRGKADGPHFSARLKKASRLGDFD